MRWCLEDGLWQFKTKKLVAIQGWETPQIPKGVKSFLGLAGYYRKYVRDFSKIVALLINLLKQEYDMFLWKEVCELAF